MYNFYSNPAVPKDRMAKLFIVLKLCLICVIVQAFSADAASKAQTITIHKKNIRISSVFEEIMKQTDYDFVYSEKQLSGLKPIDISVDNVTIEIVLDKCFKNQPVSYSIKNNTVTINTIAKSKKQNQSGDTLFPEIRGTIVNENGIPLIGATIKIKGGIAGTTTDSKGQFILTNVPNDAILIISYVGYQTKELSTKENMGTISLEPAADELQEVEINAGYYTVKAKERTSNISKISARVIEKQPINNFLQAMQGRVAGLEVVQSTGVPGGGFSVRIRGRNSIANGNDPLYIVNGIPLTSSAYSSIGGQVTQRGSALSSINPADIQSIEILKDADATAIYGSRGANGVVLITTKKGTSGPLSLKANIYRGAGSISRKLELLNLEQYQQMRAEAFKNDYLKPEDYDFDVNGTWDANNNTDWQKELIGGTANSTQGNLSLNWGSSNTSFLFSSTYYREGTVFPGNSRYQKYSNAATVNYLSLDQKFNLQFSTNYSAEDSTLPLFDPTSSILLPPNAPESLTGDGKINWEKGTFLDNPYSYLFQKYSGQTSNLSSSLNLVYSPIKGLQIATRSGFTGINQDELSTTPLSSYNPAYGLGASSRRANYGDNIIRTINIEPQVSFEKETKLGKFNMMVGATIQHNKTDQQTLTGTGYISDDLLENTSAASSLTSSNVVRSIYNFASVFGRINYNLKDRYIINLTGRRDGSSRFGPENIFANFGALGAAWIFSEEQFFNQLSPLFSFGKVRGSYGIAGNDQIGDYNFLELWNPTNPYQGSSGLYPLRLQNPAYAWESNRKIEAALELGLFEDKIMLSSSYYHNRSGNHLVRYVLAPSTGFLNILANLPAKVQNTGWEFEVSSHLLVNSAIKWTSNFNISFPKNKLLSFPGIEKSSYNNTYAVGQPLNILKAWKYTGLDAETGLYTFQDFDGNGTVSFPNDNQVIKFIGQKYSGGLQNALTYKNWELDFLLQFVKQTGKNYRAFVGAAPGMMGNQPVEVWQRWQQPGDKKDIQRYTVDSGVSIYSQARSFADFTVSDASYIRLKNISVSYSFKNLVLKKTHLNNLKLYLQAQNLVTFTSYQGLDPENQNFNALPPLRMITAGLEVSF